MSKRKANINFRMLALAISIWLTPGYASVVSAADGDLNFKVYSPDAGAQPQTPQLEGGRIPAVNDTSTPGAASADTSGSNASVQNPTASQSDALDGLGQSNNQGLSLGKETPIDDATNTPSANSANNASATSIDAATTTADPTAPSKDAAATSADTTAAGKDAAAPTADTAASQDAAAATTDTAASKDAATVTTDDTNAIKGDAASDKTAQTKSDDAGSKTNNESTASGEAEAGKLDGNKVLKGYVQVVPSGTKIPIIMDTAVDSDTSQEGDEFSARTAEDLTIDGTTVVPAGSIIRGRIATINAPKHMDRSGSVALKFDTVTTPDNRQIPLVANLVAHGGVVHARRGLKDVAIDTSIAGVPTLAGLGIGAIGGHSYHKLGIGGGALIGAGVGVAVGVAILLAKKGKKVDVRPGDELKIELAEDLHMPTM